jgi:hypothetical protein
MVVLISFASFQTRDIKEDEELATSQVREPLPDSVGGFKDHPKWVSFVRSSVPFVGPNLPFASYVLERHLKRDQVIHPRKQLGTFRGEPVFARSSVIPLKSAETYMREGRKIREGEQPLKMVKQRAVTIHKRRAQELAALEGQEPVQQGLYADWQTELVVPQPVVDVRFLLSLSFFSDQESQCGFKQLTLTRLYQSTGQGPAQWVREPRSVRSSYATQRRCPSAMSVSLSAFVTSSTGPVVDILRFSKDKGIARIAKNLGIDYAEAVVSLVVSPLF